MLHFVQTGYWLSGGVTHSRSSRSHWWPSSRITKLTVDTLGPSLLHQIHGQRGPWRAHGEGVAVSRPSVRISEFRRSFGSFVLKNFVIIPKQEKVSSRNFWGRLGSKGTCFGRIFKMSADQNNPLFQSSKPLQFKESLFSVLFIPRCCPWPDLLIL